ncbi:hypothetical protein [Luteimonas vadosa]|uniref:Sialidase family protein n=1 Tax=Luteimonas vadosa TaxID=1165507 RepID=A0ABP9DY56_9GAMM
MFFLLHGRWPVRRQSTDRPAPRRIVALSALLLLAACGGGGGGGSAPVTPPPLPPPPPPAPLPVVDPEYLVSGQSPFTANCDGVAVSGTVYINAEVEPYLAVDPLNANRMIGVWQQDRWSNGGARGLMAAVSTDGGVNWTRRPLPFSRCAGGNPANGGDYARASDPWVTFSPNGVAHAMALAITGGSFTAGSSNAMLASRSLDGGLTWSNPATLIQDGPGFFNDKNAITADPIDANFVYAVWDRLVANNGGGPTYFARTTNGGVSWEPARSIYDPGPGNQTIGNVIAATPGGLLVNLFTQIDSAGGGQTSTIRVILSSDRGLTWSPPIQIATLMAVGARDPQTGQTIRDGAILAQIAVDPNNGDLFVVWQDARFSGGSVDAIAFSRSTNGGQTWSAPVRVNNTATNVHAFTPTPYVRPDGRLAVTYYDLRANDADPNILQTEYWMAQSGDRGGSWSETRVANIFDLDTAPVANGYFLGDYQGLRSRGSVFVPFYVKSGGPDNNRTDVYSAPQVTASAVATGVQALPMPATTMAQPAPRGVTMTPLWRQRMQERIEAYRQSRLIGQPR